MMRAMATIIDGKAVSASVKERVAQEAAALKEQKGITPGLAVVIVGDDPASRVYVNNKKKACAAVDSIRRSTPFPQTPRLIICLASSTA